MRRSLLLLMFVGATLTQLMGACTTTSSKRTRTTTPRALSPGTIRVHFVNIGVGSCQLVECPGPNAPVMLIDCGTTSQPKGLNEDEALQEAKAYVNRVVGNKKVIVVISHPDKDHYHYIPDVLQGKSIQSVWVGMRKRNYRKLSGFFDGVPQDAGLYDQDQLGRGSHTTLPSSKTPLMCGKARWYILAGNVGTTRRRRKKNEASLVVMLKHGNFTAIFPGDAYGRTEQAAMRNARKLGIQLQGITVLSASHHGAHTHRSNRWFSKLRPKMVVYSAGDKYGHPSCRIVGGARQSLYKTNAHTFRCAQSSRASYQSRQSRLAEYLTATNGHIIISSSGVGKPTVACKASPSLRDSLSTNCALQ